MKRCLTPLPMGILAVVMILTWWYGLEDERASAPLEPGAVVDAEALGGAEAARLARPASAGLGTRLTPPGALDEPGQGILTPRAPALAGMGVHGVIVGPTEDMEDVPIPGALVTGRWVLDDLGGELREARTDERGGFVMSAAGLGRLLPGELAEVQVQLQVHAQGWPLWLEDLGLAPDADGRWDATITLDREPGLHLRILDPAGAPVANVDVRLEYISAGEEDWDSETSDSAGYVLFGLPAEGAQNLRLCARLAQVGYGSASWELPPASPVELILSPRGTIAGRVVDTEGRGVAGIEVFALGVDQGGEGEPDWSAAWSGTGGEFALVDLGPGDFSIEVAGVQASREVPVGTTGLELVTEWPALDVRVVGPSGAPLRGVELEVFPVRSSASDPVLPLEGGRAVPSESLGAGAFGALFPEPGLYSVLARQGESAAWDASLVQAGSQRELTLTLEPDRPQAEVELQVVDEAGRPLPEKPRIEWLEPVSGARLSTGEAGLQRLAAGPWTLRITPQDYEHVPSILSLHLEAGELRPLRVVCPRGATVELLIEGPADTQQSMRVYLWPTGTAQGDACATLELGGCGSTWTTLVRTRRRYRLIGARPAGAYVLQLDGGEGLRSSRQVDLRLGTQTLRVPAPAGLH